MNITIKQHDTKGKFTDLLRLNGVAVDLTGATVSFLMKKEGFSLKAAAAITSAAGGAVEYQPVADDVATAGTFKQEWEVVFANAAILTFPNDSYNRVTILGDLG